MVCFFLSFGSEIGAPYLSAERFARRRVRIAGAERVELARKRQAEQSSRSEYPCSAEVAE